MMCDAHGPLQAFWTSYGSSHLLETSVSKRSKVNRISVPPIDKTLQDKCRARALHRLACQLAERFTERQSSNDYRTLVIEGAGRECNFDGTRTLLVTK